MSQAKAKYITIGVLSIIIAALIVFCAIFIRQNNVLRQNLVNSQENVSQLMLLHETLEAEEFDDMHYRAIQRVLEEAPNRLRQVFDEAVELNSPEGFVMLPKNRILVSGHWHCAHTDTIYTMEAIFSFWLWNDEISIDLLSYSPFGWAGWRDPWQPDNSHWAPRHHPLETVPVRFYSMGGDWDDIWYNVEYLNGENFAEELAYFAMCHLGRIIVDAWFIDQILYINLHHSEPMRMSNGTFGESSRHFTLVSSMSSVPNIDALVILVDGQREATFGGHGATFRDFYLVR